MRISSPDFGSSRWPRPFGHGGLRVGRKICIWSLAVVLFRSDLGGCKIIGHGNATLRKVLVTGAAGFIGSHLTEELVRRNFSVRAFVHYNSMGSYGWLDSSPREIRDQLEVFSGDIRDPNGVRTAMKGCDAVCHLAALIAIPYSYHSPDTYVETNIRGTLNVLQAARDFDVSHVLHTSTSEVYGTAQFVPITEEHPLQGQSPYSASKIGADQLALSFERSFGTPVTVVRPFNTYGPRQSARAVIPTIITQIAAGQRGDQARQHPSDTRFQFCGRHGRRFPRGARGQRPASAKSSISEAGSRFRSAISRR